MKTTLLIAACFVSVSFSSYAIDPHHQAVLAFPDPLTSPRVPSTKPHANDLSASSLNLVDTLSQSSNHTVLLRLLQRTRLIPTLNRIQEFDDGSGMTILAPTDEAFLRKKENDKSARLSSVFSSSTSKSLWEWLLDQPESLADDYDSQAMIWHPAGCEIMDNVNARARQHLLYHILNYTLPYNLTRHVGSHKPNAPLPQVGIPELHETMHFPSRRLLQEPTRPGHIPKPDNEDHGGLLGHKGQMIRVATIEEQVNDHDLLSFVHTENKHKESLKALFFGADSHGNGGARSLGENWNSTKGVIFSIDDVLDLPPSLESVIKSHPSLQIFQELLSSDYIKSLSTTPHLSLFLPKSEAFSSLSELEHIFLRGPWLQSLQQRLVLTGWHTSGTGLGGGKPAYANEIRKAGSLNMTILFGGQVLIVVDKDEQISVMGARVVEQDILTENGVVHIVDKLILPFGDLDMSVEKYLLALNASRFVEMVYKAGLERYINQPPHRSNDDRSESFTILAPRNDVFNSWMQSHSDKGGPPTLEEVVKYHILPGQVLPQNLTNGMLLGTELRDWRLRQGRQMLPVQVNEDKIASERRGNGDVGFGDANVLQELVKVKDQAIIYIISQLLQPPSDPVQTAVSHLDLSTYLATVFSAGLTEAIQRAPGVTFMIPTNEAFAALGLTMKYLVLPESRNELQALVEYHAIDKIVYMADFSESIQEYRTLLPAEGAKLWARKSNNGTVFIGRADETSGATAARVIKGNILTNNGVIHEIDRLEVPLDITIKKLLRGAKADTMEDLMNQAGYGHILNGTSVGSCGPSYVVLVPNDNAFTRVNLSYIMEDHVRLQELVKQHIIPLNHETTLDAILPNGRKNRLQLKDESTFATLMDRDAGGPSRYGRVSFRNLEGWPENVPGADGSIAASDDDLGWIVGIRDTRGASARQRAATVIAFGRESRQMDNKSSQLCSSIGGVIEIDTVLIPYTPSWFYRWGGVVAAIILAASLLSSATLVGYRWWNRDGRIRLPEALEGEEE